MTLYFLVLAMAGNLFTGTGYFLFSGVANFGDWKQVITGLHPQWAWRVGLIVLGAVSYYASMLLVSAKLRAFQGRESRTLRTGLRDSLFHRRSARRRCRAVQFAGIVLHDGFSAAVDAGCELRFTRSAKHDLPRHA